MQEYIAFITEYVPEHILEYIIGHIDALAYRLDWKELILGLATPIFLFALAVEIYVLRFRPEIFQMKEIICNFSLGFMYQGVEVVLYFFFVGAFMHWLWGFRFFEINLNFTNVLIGFFVLEFLYYWYHRCNHRVRYFWCSHVVHHSSENMNLSTATRQSMTYALSGGVVLFFSPLILIGFPPEVVMSLYALDLFYQYFVHTQAINKMPDWFEFFFNTPSHHRVHHGKNKEYIDKNYGGVVIIFDRIFGSFAEENPKDNPVQFGIVKPINTLNVFKINFHEWFDMIGDISKPGTIGYKLKHIWAPPEWQREVSRKK